MRNGRHLNNTSSARITKRALIASAACTILCGLLLFSTTVAWFTADRASGANELYSGNLDVRLSYSKDMENWKDVANDSNIFKVKGDNDENEHDMRWEPGAVNVVYFKIENKGNLTAKYDFAVVIDSEVGGTNFAEQSFKLSDYIKGGVVENITEAYANRTNAITTISENAKTLQAIHTDAPLISGEMEGVPDTAATVKQEKTFALVLYMPEDPVTSEATNYKTPTDDAPRPGVKLKVKLVATQDVGENDSFGNQYDKGAVYTDVTATTPAELTAAISNAQNGDVIGIGGNDLVLTQNLMINNDITIVGDGSAAIEKYPTYVGADNTVTFKNVKFNDTTFSDKSSSVYGNSFKGTLVFDGCTFDLNHWESAQITPAGDCTIVFNKCTFNGYEGAQRFIHIQPIGNGDNTFKLNVTITNCTFNNCEKVNFTKGGTVALTDDNKGSVIDLDYFAQGSTVTMGNNTFNLSSSSETYPLHPYFCTAPYAPTSVLCGEPLLTYLTGAVHTYNVTASGLTN